MNINPTKDDGLPCAIRCPRPMICQVTSRHAIEDERILHRMAWTAAKYGYHSRILGPRDGNGHSGAVELMGCFPARKRLRPVDRILVPVQLLRGALASRCRVFQIHDPDLLPLAVVLKLLGRRVIYDVHDDYEASVRNLLSDKPIMGGVCAKTWWLWERLAAGVCDAVVVADRHLAAKFAGCHPVILGNYPKYSFTKAADTTTEHTFNVIYVGGVARDRGVGVALDALALLPQKDIRLHIVGTCRDEALLTRLQAESRVVLHGFVSWEALHQHYEKAHMGLALYQPITSFLYYPGENSVKVIEYMAAGIPVLCSDFPGLKTFVETAGYGLTVKPDDPSAVARRIQELYDNPVLRMQLGQNGRHAFEEEYNWERHEDKLVALYTRLTGGACSCTVRKV